MRTQYDSDPDYLLDCLNLTPEERLQQLSELIEFSIKLNDNYKNLLENDHPEVFELT